MNINLFIPDDWIEDIDAERGEQERLNWLREQILKGLPKRAGRSPNPTRGAGGGRPWPKKRKGGAK